MNDQPTQEIEVLGEPKPRGLLWLAIAASLVVVVLAGTVVALVVKRGDKAREQIVREEIKPLEEKAKRTRDTLGDTRKELIQSEVIRQRGTSGSAGRPGGQGRQGSRGGPGPTPSDEAIDEAVGRRCALTMCGRLPTPDQVRDALLAICGPDCRGRSGEPGKDAPPVTTTDLDARVAAYCATRDQCAGRAGQNGQNGADSIVAGPQGPQGEKGEKGDFGEPAPQPVTGTCVPTVDPADDPARLSCTFP